MQITDRSRPRVKNFVPPETRLTIARHLYILVLVLGVVVVATVTPAMADGPPPGTYTFELPTSILQNGQPVEFDLYVLGNPSAYAQLQAQYGSFPLGAQAGYLSGYLLGTCCPINGMSAYSGGQQVTLSNLPSGLLAQTLLWGESYANLVWWPGALQQLQAESTEFQNAVATEWRQQLGIDLGNLANLATIFLPIIDDWNSKFGSQGAQQLLNAVLLLNDVVQGSQQLAADYQNEATAIVSQIETLGLAAGSGMNGSSYDQSVLVTTLAAELQDGTSPTKIIQSLYNAAYPSQPLSTGVLSVASNFVSTLGQNTISGTETSALQGGFDFAETYFQHGLTLSTWSAGATSFLDSLSYQFPAVVGDTIISAYVMPLVSLTQQEVNIQNLVANSLFPQFLPPTGALSQMTLQQETLANVSAGAAAAYSLGLIYSFESLWYETDYQLVTNGCVLCANSPAVDAGAAQTFASGTAGQLTTIQNATILAGSIPPMPPAPPSGLTATAH